VFIPQSNLLNYRALFKSSLNLLFERLKPSVELVDVSKLAGKSEVSPLSLLVLKVMDQGFNSPAK
jgi:hypothetical protein